MLDGIRDTETEFHLGNKLEIRQIEVASEAGCQKKLCRDSAQIVTLLTRDIECGHNSGCDVSA